MIICDTAPLFCLVDKSQPRHLAVKNFVKNNPNTLITTWSCFTEAMYLSLQRGGWLMQNQLSKLLLEKLLFLEPIETTDYVRLFQLMDKYKDRPMDLANGTLVIVAEKLNINSILTFDSDFFFYLINDKQPFNVINLVGI
ncbi:MAG: PIN domain-containing protein [Cyanobacteria bacterium]|nr:PIN domain-containing protein [Cyanobacteria bacterium CG_2015-16_32_12]NCQ03580.1 PIN domain-containing protein [Cyanobacteria bacterium CG_2015-09_32_10]NCQ40307.1 PIN domain-containing protein [Cyanobacteria bacterium CG_2015-04_32_10]NCS84623.1 PIN domain-containing protein [Cyanobacteria bacterium CG_2015-02_32_10]